MKRQYGWKKDLPDFRDYTYAVPEHLIAKLPPSVNLQLYCPPILDQGSLGSCTANAVASAHLFDQMNQKDKSLTKPSRLFIYYNERVLEGTTKYDSGATLRSGMKTLAKQGVCSERQWKYVVSKFAQKPTLPAYKNALKHQALIYMRIAQTLAQMKGCLASGYPFVFGFAVYESFESDTVVTTGVVPMPKQVESLLGGHAVMAVGYNDDAQRFLVMNSWGVKWGDNGYFTIPYGYLTDRSLADDFWTLRLVEI